MAITLDSMHHVARITFSKCIFRSIHLREARCGRFDLIVVSLSLVALGPLQVPVVVIRSMRAFRIARLFRRIKSLSSIIMALTASIIPVINAYLVLLIAMCICELPDRELRHWGPQLRKIANNREQSRSRQWLARAFG
jgi:hypothetical protein